MKSGDEARFICKLTTMAREVVCLGLSGNRVLEWHPQYIANMDVEKYWPQPQTLHFNLGIWLQ